MARRITVVLSQSARPNPTQRDLEGTLVAELLMVHGLEVTLIPDLGTLQDGDTGMLCLEGISSDMVMLTWADATEAHEHLSSRSILGRPGRTRLAEYPSVDSQHPRTIFYIDLNRLDRVADCCEEIQRIREEATVKTYDLGIELPLTPKETKGADRPSPPAQSDAGQAAAPTPSSHTDEAEADAEDEQLERLMDQLDEWDA